MDSSHSATSSSSDPRPASMGLATMADDGGIVLRLRAQLDEGDGAGEGYFRYPPGTVEHQRVVEHVGGLEPGQSKPVPPWPDGDD